MAEDNRHIKEENSRLKAYQSENVFPNKKPLLASSPLPTPPQGGPFSLTPSPSIDLNLLMPRIAEKLHSEIVSFVSEHKIYTEKHKPLFDSLVEEVIKCLKEVSPEIDAVIYGSYRTNLWMPWSDIDLVINLPGLKDGEKMSRMSQIEEALKGKKTLFSEVKFVQNAMMPVIKLVSSEDYQWKKIDITFKEESDVLPHNGENCVELVNTYLRQYKPLHSLVLVFKQILFLSKMNDPYLVSSKGRNEFLRSDFVPGFLSAVQVDDVQGLQLFSVGDPERFGLPPQRFAAVLREL